MANQVQTKLTNKKQLLNSQKIKLRKQIVRLDRMINNTDPDSPLYTKYVEEKEKLTVQLYEKETDYEETINRLDKDVKKLKELIKERTSRGFFDPGDPRLQKDLQAAWNRAKDIMNLHKQYRDFKQKLQDDLYEKLDGFFDKWEQVKDSYTYRFFYSGVRGLTAIGKGIGKMALNAVLTKKVDQKRFLGFSYGGRRVNKYKFNNNLMRKYSNDYQDLKNDFYLLGKGFYNRNIKKGQLDAGDVITYMKSQGRTSEEILDQLKELTKYGLIVSKTYLDLLDSRKLKSDESDEFEDIYDSDTMNQNDVNYQNTAMAIDEQNKETLKSVLIQFYEWIEDRNKPEEKSEGIFSVLLKALKSLGETLLSMGGWLVAAFASGGVIGLALTGAIIAIWYFFGDEIKKWFKKGMNSLWQLLFHKNFFNESSNNFIRGRRLSKLEVAVTPFPKSEDFDNLPSVMKAPTKDASGRDIDPEIIQAIEDASAETGLDPYFIAGVIQQESNFNPRAVGPMTRYGTAKGLMQFIDPTWEDWGEGSPFDARKNILAGARYLKWLMNQTGGDKAKTLAAYNFGIGNVRRQEKKLGINWASGLPRETDEYVKQILNHNKNMLEVNDPKTKQLQEVVDSSDPVKIEGLTNSKIEEASSEMLPMFDEASINEMVNENIIRQQEAAAAESRKAKQEAATTTPTKRVNGTEPEVISIPSHLGGGGLELLNSGARF